MSQTPARDDRGMRSSLPSWVHDDASMVRLKIESGPHPAGASERRAACRIPVELDVVIHGDAHFFQTTTADVSKGGMFLVTTRADRLPPGTRLVLDFTLPGGPREAEALEVAAVVAWVRTEAEAARGSGPAGVAVAFAGLSPETEARIEEYCKVREPLYFDLFEGAG